MTNLFAGRSYETAQKHYLYADVTFANDGSTVSLGWLPEDGVIDAVTVITTTAFNAGTANVIDVGYRNRGDGVADNAAGLANDASLAAAGVGVVSLATTANLAFTGGGEVTATVALTGTAATAGAARVLVEYTVATDAP